MRGRWKPWCQSGVRKARLAMPEIPGCACADRSGSPARARAEPPSTAHGKARWAPVSASTAPGQPNTSRGHRVLLLHAGHQGGRVPQVPKPQWGKEPFPKRWGWNLGGLLKEQREGAGEQRRRVTRPVMGTVRWAQHAEYGNRDRFQPRKGL